VRRRRRTDAPVRCSASVETRGGGKATAEGLIESGTALIGSPKTVLAGIERMRERTGFGILSDALTRRNMDLFAAEVMPHLRD
jgi:alkanesulfonate monooxygenase SsuD/methylene tetrahydromethanopterin reductase-like flavin-dependent oxidoreductase (luciferase family)